MSRKRHRPVKWRLEWLAQCSIERLFTLLPGRVVFRLGEWLGLAVWHLVPERRRTLRKNLRIVFAGARTKDEIDAMARTTCMRIGANLASALRTARIPAEELLASVTMENPELLHDAVKDGRGLVLLPPHMGNWELLSRINPFYPAGHPCGALFRPLNNPLLNARVKHQRESEGTRLFSKRDSLHHITGFLRDGGILGVLADQRAGLQGRLAVFFGRLTRATPLPELLVRRCKAAALAVSIRTSSAGNWTLKFHEVNPPYDTQACALAIESAMRESLCDVFWMHDRWRIYLGRGRTIQQWLGDGSSQQDRRHRALLWIEDVPADWTIPDEWNHQDVDYEVVLPPHQSLPEALAGLPLHSLERTPEGWRDIRRILRKIDAGRPLPIDFLLAPSQFPKGISRACKREAIAFTCIRASRV